MADALIEGAIAGTGIVTVAKVWGKSFRATILFEKGLRVSR